MMTINEIFKEENNPDLESDEVFFNFCYTNFLTEIAKHNLGDLDLNTTRKSLSVIKDHCDTLLQICDKIEEDAKNIF